MHTRNSTHSTASEMSSAFNSKLDFLGGIVELWMIYKEKKKNENTKTKNARKIGRYARFNTDSRL